jgi:NAD(P)H-hydrate epimerase
METFDKLQLKGLRKVKIDSSNEDNGQVTIVGGSRLFHGAPLLSLKVASRIVDMVFFASKEPSVGRVAERIKSELFSFIWVPWEEVGAYIEKSDAVLIGPGLMRFESEHTGGDGRELDGAGEETYSVTKDLLGRFPDKRWVVDAGSLQVIKPQLLPKGSIITPNKKEFEHLFNLEASVENVSMMAKKHECIIVAKGPETIVCSGEGCLKVKGGNPGLTKGGTGDVLAGLTVALLAKNDSLLAACAASFVVKAAGDKLYEEVATNYNADDLVERIPQSLKDLVG